VNSTPTSRSPIDASDAAGTPDRGAAEDAILRLLAAAGPGKTVSPIDAARELVAGTDWHRIMATTRAAAVRLAVEGQLVIYRKGRPVDPHNFKGVYRLGLPHHD